MPDLETLVRQQAVTIDLLERRIAVLEGRVKRWAANGLEPLDRMSAHDWLGKPV